MMDDVIVVFLLMVIWYIDLENWGELLFLFLILIFSDIVVFCNSDVILVKNFVFV